ncbi:MAG: cupin domain-containing protein [Tunicatimonas sp.]|uniref:cupin domain-containing protein n=1 Tax=Tunicatimonas sp. TaxID=1940096 RepID=UPI003C76FE8C
MLFLLIIVLFAHSPVAAQQPSTESGAYHWEEADISSSDIRVRRHFLKGSTRDLSYLELHATTLAPGQPLHPLHTHEDREELIIIKEGSVEVAIEQEKQVVGPGSVALIMPGDQHNLTNVGQDSATFYILLYTAKSAPNQQRAAEVGGSLVVDWEDVPFQEREKGGVRSFFERATVMLERLEMHVTTLNPGIQSHPPHTHRPAEIILMLEGESQEFIDGEYFNGSGGDLYFLGSETEHTIKNTGTEPCTYFAFQFR